MIMLIYHAQLLNNCKNNNNQKFISKFSLATRLLFLSSNKCNCNFQEKFKIYVSNLP